MISKAVPLVAVLALAACGGSSTNPLGTGGSGAPGDGGSTTPGDTTPGGGDPGAGSGGDSGGITSDRVLPPGTTSPSRTAAIRRNEAMDSSGNGYARDMRYDSTNDTFHVDNLGFDANNTYVRGTSVGSLGPFAVYEGTMTYPDSATGAPIDQLRHRALYGVSRSGQTEFAVVRTGSYIPYGFGGFAYQRNGSVTLPTTGQATFSGDYAGLRDFNGIADLEYTTGDMRMDIDFRDFDSGNAVKGTVSNRAIYDLAGNDITADVLTALNTVHGSSKTELPVLGIKIAPGSMDSNGEIIGNIGSNIVVPGNAAQEYETGKYYAVVSGTEPDEVTGIIVVETSDPRHTGAIVRETGGFILYRRP